MDLDEILEVQGQHMERTGDGRVVCKLTGHSLPARADVVLAYLKGRQYKKAKDRSEAEKLASEHADYIQTSKNLPEMFFCSLTNRLLAKTYDSVRKHVSGKRFQLAKEAVTAGGGVLYQEPDVFDAEDTKDEIEDDQQEDKMEQGMSNTAIAIDPTASNKRRMEWPGGRPPKKPA